MALYEKAAGRVSVKLWRKQDGGGIEVAVPDGWNSSCPILTLRLSREEARDLQYMLGRAVVIADSEA